MLLKNAHIQIFNTYIKELVLSIFQVMSYSKYYQSTLSHNNENVIC